MTARQPTDAAAPERFRIVIGIPTVSRAHILRDTIRFLVHQQRLPDLVIISVADAEHAGGIEREDLPFPVEIVVSPKGLSKQRNCILRRIRHGDILMFLDDDFLMAPDYLQEVETLFATHPEIVLATGTIVADGILGPGLSHAAGVALLESAVATPAPRTMRPEHTGYGCNTALRASTVIETGLRFDERLPLYSWLEDVDFSTRLQPYGRFVRPQFLRGVHLGTKTGRTPGKNLGYSQIANPVYMMRKGTIGRRRALGLMARNVASNIVSTMRPRPWADYRGRLIGNLTAFVDLARGCCDPERILEFNREHVYRNGRWRNRAS